MPDTIDFVADTTAPAIDFQADEAPPALNISKLQPGPVFQPSQFSSGQAAIAPPSVNPDWAFTQETTAPVARGIQSGINMARVLAPSVKAGLGVAVDQAGAPARESLALLDPVAKPVGQVLDRAGNILVAAPSDVGAYLGNPKSGFRGENLMAAAEDRPLPAEQAFKESPAAMRIPAEAAAGIARSVPRLGAAAANPALAPIAFGATSQGFDVKQAVLAEALPYIGTKGGKFTEFLAQKLGISSDRALMMINKAGGATAAAGLVTADQARQISKLPEGQKRDAWFGLVGNVLGILPLSVMGEREKPSTEKEPAAAPADKPAAAEEPLTAEKVLSKPPGSHSAADIASMSQTEFRKLIEAKDESGKTKYTLTGDATLWAMKQTRDVLPELVKLRDAAVKDTLASLKRGEETHLDKSQWFADAIHAIERDDVGKQNVEKFSSPEMQKAMGITAAPASAPAVEAKPAEAAPAPPVPVEPAAAAVAAPKTPERTAEEVQTAVTDTAVKEGTPAAKEVKSQLLGKIRDSIETAPTEESLKLPARPSPTGKSRFEFNRQMAEFTKALEQSGAKKIRINIPGDGDFQVWNTKEALSEFERRTQRLETNAGRPQKTRVSGLSKEDREWVEAQRANQPQPAERTGEEELALLGQTQPVQPEQPVLTGPGAQPAGEPQKPELAQLTDALRTMAQGQPRPPMGKAFSLGEKLSEAKDAAGKALDGLRAANKVARDVFNGLPTWNGLKAAVGNWKLALYENGVLSKNFIDQAIRAVPDDLNQGAISKWLDAGGDDAKLLDAMVNAPAKTKKYYRAARALSPELKTLAENSRNYFESRMQQAIDEGFFEQGIEDYIHRIYEKDSPWKRGVLAELRTSGVFTGKPAFAKRRALQYDYEAEQAGYPIIHSFIRRTAAYDFAMNKAIADRALVKSFMQEKMPDGRPAIEISGVGIPAEGGKSGALLVKPNVNRAITADGRPYIPYDHAALRKWKWLETDAAGKSTLLQGNALVHPDAVKQVNAVFGRSKIRQYGIGRGALKVGSVVKQTMLDLSGFHRVQITVHGWEHKTFKPVEKIDLENPVHRSLIQHGMEVGGGRANEMFSEGNVGSSLTKYIPKFGPKLQALKGDLFEDYIPRLKMAMGEHALDRNREVYKKELASGEMSEDQLLAQTANEANAAFGELNWEMMAKSKTTQDVLRLVFLSPDFTIARGQFVGQAFTKYGSEQRWALARGAIFMYVAARIINKMVDGQYHFEPRNMFSIVLNKKAYSLRTVQGDLIHLITDPAKFASSRLNPALTRPVMEAMMGRDAFGRKRSPLEQLEDYVRSPIPISLRGLVDKREQTVLEAFLNSMGITNRRDTSNDETYKLAQSWKEAHGVGEPGEFIYDPDKDPYRRIKLALVFSKPEDAAQEISIALKEKKIDPEKLENYFERYGTTAFTGSRANDRVFYQSLTADQKKTFDAAVAERAKLRTNLVEAFRLYRENFSQVK
jgi:hypothetical protein